MQRQIRTRVEIFRGISDEDSHRGIDVFKTGVGLQTVAKNDIGCVFCKPPIPLLARPQSCLLAEQLSPVISVFQGRGQLKQVARMFDKVISGTSTVTPGQRPLHHPGR